MRFVKSLLATLVAIALVTTSHAAVLLTIDVSNPAAVTITATGSFAATDNTTTFVDQGIDLVDFFSLSVNLSESIIISSLVASGVPPSAFYNEAQSDLDLGDIDPVTGMPKKNNLNLYNSTSGSEQVFETSSAAFSGAATIDLSSVSAALPANGTSGTIMSGNSGAAGSNIGTWQVVSIPEPSTSFLLAAAAGLTTLLARRRSQSHPSSFGR